MARPNPPKRRNDTIPQIRVNVLQEARREEEPKRLKLSPELTSLFSLPEVAAVAPCAEGVLITLNSHPSVVWYCDARGHLAPYSSQPPKDWRLRVADRVPYLMNSSKEEMRVTRFRPDAADNAIQDVCVVPENLMGSFSTWAGGDVIFDAAGSTVAYAVPVDTGATSNVYITEFDGTPVAAGSFARRMQPAAIDASGQHAILRSDDLANDQHLWFWDVRAKLVREILPHSEHARCRQVAWLRDGTLLALTEANNDYLTVMAVDTRSPDFAAKPLFGFADRPIDQFVISPDEKSLAVVSNDRGASGLWLLDRNTGARRRVTNIPFGVITDISWSGDGASLIVAMSTPDAPARLRRVDPRTATAKPISLRSADLDRLRALDTFRPLRGMVIPEIIEYPASDGRSISALLAMPPGPGPHPAIVWVHGGPDDQSRPYFDPEVQALVAHGFAVLAPNFRGSSGESRHALSEDDGLRRPRAIADIADGAALLRKSSRIRADKIVVAGFSYGGYAAAAAAAQSDAFNACVAMGGPVDLEAFIGGITPWRAARRGIEYGETPEIRAQLSPANAASQISVPVLVVHGERDPVVPCSVAEQFVQKLSEQKVPVEFVVRKKVGHSLGYGKTHAESIAIIIDFLHRHLELPAR